MVNKIFVKIVFINNNFESKIDVFSVPIISTVVSVFDQYKEIPSSNNNNNNYIRYERGSDNPDSLRRDYSSTNIQYELFEFAYKSFSNASNTIPRTRYLERRKRFHKQRRNRGINSGVEMFKREISWCVIKNSNFLCQSDNNSNRFCHVNTTKGINSVSTSLCDFMYLNFDIENLDNNNSNDNNNNNNNNQDFYNGCRDILGYMKVFSKSAKLAYINSLNYRNIINLYNHIIVYFDVSKYYYFNSCQIFKIPFETQINIINRDLLLDNNGDNDDKVNNDINENIYEEKLDNLENLLCEEVLFTSPPCSI